MDLRLRASSVDLLLTWSRTSSILLHDSDKGCNGTIASTVVLRRELSVGIKSICVAGGGLPRGKLISIVEFDQLGEI